MVKYVPYTQQENVCEMYNFSKSLQGKKYQIDDKLSMVYQSDKMKQVMEKVQYANKIPRPVLITGETGTGKELIARMVLNKDSNITSPFIAINCAAVPQTLWEEDLFGHTKGAYTDAGFDRMGKIAQAENGILFFDEIGEIPMNIQAKLLRLLQEKQYMQIGGNKLINAACRFVFATNQNIKKMIMQAKFRKDLYYRINVFHIHLPPLRKRKEDIPVLLQYFIERYTDEFKLDFFGIENTVLKILLNYDWPGNIRQLENIIVQSFAKIKSNSNFKTKKILTPNNLPEYLIRKKQKASLLDKIIRPENLTISSYKNFNQHMKEYAIKLITWALDKTNGNKTGAAKILGINRTTLIYKMKELHIN